MQLVYEKVDYKYDNTEEKEKHEREMIKNGWKINIMQFGYYLTSYERKEFKDLGAGI